MTLPRQALVTSELSFRKIRAFEWPNWHSFHCWEDALRQWGREQGYDSKREPPGCYCLLFDWCRRLQRGWALDVSISSCTGTNGWLGSCGQICGNVRLPVAWYQNIFLHFYTLQLTFSQNLSKTLSITSIYCYMYAQFYSKRVYLVVQDLVFSVY